MSLHTLFAPKSIAVIGASTTSGSVGNDVAKNLIESDFSGQVYLVNPRTKTLFGRTCYPSIDAVPGAVELAIIIVPAKVVPEVLRAAGERMIRTAIIISAGFKESGPAGQALETEIITIAQEFKISVLGPNCLGFINPLRFLNASFASSIPDAGSVAFFSQSGALTSAFLDLTQSMLGFSLFVSIGNKALIDEIALLDYLFRDEATRTIGMYTENLTDAKHIIALGRDNLSSKLPKPIVALKAGTTAAGTLASSSHTGAIAGSEAAYNALFRQARIIRAESFETLMESLLVLDQNPLARGKRVAIVTNAGGFGVLATDACIQAGLELASLQEKTVQALQAVLPPAANTHNPVDVLGDALADRYAQALNIIATDEGVDCILILLTPQTMTEAEVTAEAIVNLRQSFPALPLAAVFSGNQLVQTAHAVLRKHHIPVFLYPEAGARALGALIQFSEWQRSLRREVPTIRANNDQVVRAREILTDIRASQTLQLGEAQAALFLSAYGFPFLRNQLVTTVDAAAAFAHEINAPIVLKIASPDIIHKSDVGGVILNVKPEAVAVTYEHLLTTVRLHAPDARIEGVTVTEMAMPGGRELLLGLKKEPGLGALIVIGLGGIHVETFHDIAMRFAPLLPSDIDAMLDELHSLPLLMGSRGESGIDLEELKKYIALLSQLAVDFPEIEELDINPLVAFPDATAFRVLDARLRISGSV